METDKTKMVFSAEHTHFNFAEPNQQRAMIQFVNALVSEFLKSSMQIYVVLAPVDVCYSRGRRFVLTWSDTEVEVSIRTQTSFWIVMGNCFSIKSTLCPEKSLRAKR